jgi:hypothetical protein
VTALALAGVVRFEQDRLPLPSGEPERSGGDDRSKPTPAGDDPCKGEGATPSPGTDGRGPGLAPAERLGRIGLPGTVALALAPPPEPDEEPASDEPLPTLARLKRCEGRTKTLPNKALSREEVRAGRLIVYPDVDRPRTRGDCEGSERPCPFVSCRYHLYLDVDPISGAVKLNFPEREPDELAETCALDVADRGGVTLEQTADYVNLTRERIRQLEVAALKRARVRNLETAAQLDGADIRSSVGLGESPWMSGEGGW